MPSGKHAGSRGKQQRPRAVRASASPRSQVPVLVAGAAVVLVVGIVALALRPSAAAPSAPPQGVQTAQEPPGGAAAPGTLAAGPGSGTTEKAAVTIEDGAVRLAADQFGDRRARHYTAQSAGTTISFFVLKSSDGVIRAAFDACDVCYPARKGYHQEGEVMVCNNCGNRFPSTRINVEKGGCNPAPLTVKAEGDAIVIQAADLEAGARYF